MMKLQKLSKTYTTAAGEFHAIQNVNLTIEKGELVAIKGRSGSGKSTLLNLVGAIDTPSSGCVMVDDVDIHCLKPGELSRWRGTNVGFVFQFFQLLPTLTSVENVMLPMDFCRTFPARERRRRALDLLERVGVAEQADKVPSMLSGGQQQRVAVARALANDPCVILADEPTGNLDSVTAEEMIELFREMASSGTAIIIATHDREVADIADTVITLIDGTIGFPASNLRSLSMETAQ